MPVLKRPDGEIHYEEYGQGYPILLFAPGGMRSRAEMWHDPAGGPPRPWSDWTQSLAGSYRVIAMDQRNAGRSRTAIEADHGWHTYAADHLALMDHLGFRQFHTLGGCIGGSFCLKLCEVAPDRVDRRGAAEPDRIASRSSGIFPGKLRRVGDRSRRRNARSLTMRRSPRSARTCGMASSCSA